MKHINRFKCWNLGMKAAKMKKIILLAATSLTLIIGLNGAATAADRGLLTEIRSSYQQNHRGYRSQRHILKPQQISRMMQRRGYRVRSIRYERGNYFVSASKRHGRQVMLIVDARSGRIKGQRPIHRRY